MGSNILPITMPKWGLAMKEGSIVKWNREVGEEIKKGEALVEIETEKVVNEFESPENGTLIKKCIELDEKVPVGSLIAIYGDKETSDDEINKFIIEFNENFENSSEDSDINESATKKIKIEDLDINFFQIGDADKKNLLFIHGFGGDLNNWMFNQEELSKDFNTYSLDLPGHGSSSKDIKKEIEISFFTKNIVKFCEQNNLKKINLVGHSFGAGISIDIANKNKELVESLILISPIGLGKEIDNSYLEGFVSADSRRDLKKVLEKLYFDSSIITRDLLNEVLKIKRFDGISDALNLIKNVILHNEFQKNDLRKDIENIKIPISIIWGKDDNIIPNSHSSNLNGNIKVNIIDDCGHMAHVEKSQEVNSLIKETIN